MLECYGRHWYRLHALGFLIIWNYFRPLADFRCFYYLICDVLDGHQDRWYWHRLHWDFKEKLRPQRLGNWYGLLLCQSLRANIDFLLAYGAESIPYIIVLDWGIQRQRQISQRFRTRLEPVFILVDVCDYLCDCVCNDSGQRLGNIRETEFIWCYFYRVNYSVDLWDGDLRFHWYYIHHFTNYFRLISIIKRTSAKNSIFGFSYFDWISLRKAYGHLGWWFLFP